MKHIFLPLALLLACSLHLHAQWERVAFHAGGQVNALARTPDSRLWAGTRTGLFRSADNGNSWSREVGIAPTWMVQDAELVGGELKTVSVQSLGHPAYRVVLSEQGPSGSFSHTVLPSLNPGGTNGRSGVFEANGRLVVWSGSQITQRIGTAWSLMQLPAISLYDVHGDGTLIAAAVQENGGSLSRLRFTANGGTLWQTPALPGASMTEHVVAVHVRGTRIWAVYSNGDLYRSEDSGQNWAKMASPSLAGFSYYKTYFRWDEVLDRLMICVDGLLYASPNLGANWMSMGTVFRPQEIKDFLPEGDVLSVGGSAGFSQRLTASSPFALSNSGLQGDPAFDVKTYGGESFAVYTTGVQRTTDGGSTWSALNIGVLGDADFREIRGFEKNGDRLYLLTNQGLLLSVDNGATWPANYAWSGTAKGIQLGAPGELWLATAQDQTVTVVSEADPSQVIRTFSTLLAPGTNDNLYFVYYDPWDGNILGYLPETSTLYASANKGKDWVMRSTVPGPLNLAGKLYQASGTNGRLFFLSSNAIYYSTDHAYNWTASGGSTGSMGAFMEMVEMDGNLYALSLSKGLLRSINNGTSWSLAFNNATDIWA
ncbi:MAG TPA: hypothetical protein PKD78_04830, partial [Saprospiraceae bacterium]|nr:hypothetical protein [Saprospiraceae bacterium]